MRKDTYRSEALHRAKCTLCASPNRERYESDLLSGGDLHQIRRALNSEIKEKTGKAGTVSLKAIVKHKMLLGYPSRPNVQPPPFPDLSENEILTLPLARIRERFQRMIWATCVSIIDRVKCRVSETSEETSVDNLVEALQRLMTLGLLLPDPPASRRSTESGPTISEMFEFIADPGDRQVFIEAQRGIQRGLRTTLELQAKYKKRPADATADEAIHDDNQTR
jgi:hypothetical protein